MLTEQQRERLRILQRKEFDAVLDTSEMAELDQLFDAVEANEAAYLRPATQRVEQEGRSIEAQNAAMRELITRQERLARRLDRVLRKATVERQAIQSELVAILGSASFPAEAGR